ncbi:MAG: HD domain-containing protein [Candidatus Methanoperedens sp.]|nr:HD domain-containing protein [Candidatus Methanoperedens sp.]
MNLENVVQESYAFAKHYMSQTHVPGHGWWHAENVYKLGKIIADSEPDANYYLVEISCLLHELGRIHEYLNKNDEINHSLASRKIAEIFLAKSGVLSKAELNIILTNISEHSIKGKPTYIEGRILQDADKLDGMGAVGLLRIISSESYNGLKEFDPYTPFGPDFIDGDIKKYIKQRINPDSTDGLRTNEFIIEHMIGREMQWINMLWTKKGKEMAMDKFSFMEKFLYQFKLEMDVIS